MLILRRNVEESVVVGGVITISILAVEGRRVKLGISAPSEVTIMRQELLCNKAAESQDESVNSEPPFPH